jgi:hypothetical protein
MSQIGLFYVRNMALASKYSLVSAIASANNANRHAFKLRHASGFTGTEVRFKVTVDLGRRCRIRRRKQKRHFSTPNPYRPHRE